MAINADHTGKRYTDLDLDHESFDGYTSLKEMKVEQRLDARCMSVDGNANLRKLQINDRFYGWSMDVNGNADLSGSKLGDWYFRGSTVEYNLIARDVHVAGDADMKQVDAERMMLPGITVDGTLSLQGNDTEYIDLRGATIAELHIDDLDAYDIRVDDDTYIGDVSVGTGMPDDTTLSDDEQEWYDKLLDRPRSPHGAYDGCMFTHDVLGQNFVMTDKRNGLLGSLIQKDVVYDLDEEYRLIRSDI